MLNYTLIVTIVPKGWGDSVLRASVDAGARGGTVLLGRGSGVNEQQRFLGIQIEPEKEIVLTITEPSQNDEILDAIVREARLDERGRGLAFVVPIDKIAGVSALTLTSDKPAT